MHRGARLRLDSESLAAIQASNLRTLPPDAVAELTASAVRQEFPAGSTIHWEGETSPHLHVVMSGLVRAYVSALDGRTMTIRYCREGALLGVATLFASPSALPASTQAVTDVELLTLLPSVVGAAAHRDVRVARALLDELSERVLSFIAEIPRSAFASVRQRVARHLLDIAADSQKGTELVTPISQQDLAEAVGSVREVVIRALRELRQEGLLRTGRDGLVVLDPERLAGVASVHVDSRGGTKVADGS